MLGNIWFFLYISSFLYETRKIYPLASLISFAGWLVGVLISIVFASAKTRMRTLIEFAECLNYGQTIA